MNDLPGLPPVSADKSVGAPVPDPAESLESGTECQQIFDDALSDSRNLHEAQAPETRRAIKGSLDRLPGRQRARAAPGHRADKGLQDRPGAGNPAESGGAGRTASPGPAAGEGNRSFADTPEDTSPGTAPGVSAPIGDRPKVSPQQARMSGRNRQVEENAPVPVPAGSRGAAPRRYGGTSGPMHKATQEPGMAPGGTGTRAAERSTERTATGRSQQSDPARGTAANPAARRRYRSIGKRDGRRSSACRRYGSSETRKHCRCNAPRRLRCALTWESSAGCSKRRGSTTAFARPPECRRRRTGLDRQGRLRESSGPARTATLQRRVRPGRETRGPDDAGIAEAQPTDLTGLATPAGAPEPGNVAAPETVQPPASSAVAIAEQVADRILVAAPEPGTSGEVRISLGESVLDGSDVRIFREGGELRIVFLPSTEAAGQLLTDNGTVFQQALGERLQDERVRVEVELPGQGAAGQQDSEGRSRQRYVSPDDPARHSLSRGQSRT